ncbi:MAG TPA: hypothetical protein VGC67_05790 [Cellulomonas sp.]
MSTTERTTHRRGRVLRWTIGVLLFVLGFFAYWLSDLFLDQYISFGMSWVIVGVMSVAALGIWIIDEVRGARQDREVPATHDR